MDITTPLPSPLHSTQQQPAPNTTQPTTKAPNGFAYPLSTTTGLPKAMVTQRCGMKLAGVSVAFRSQYVSSSGVRCGKSVELEAAPAPAGFQLAVGSALKSLHHASPWLHQSAPQTPGSWWSHHHEPQFQPSDHCCCCCSCHLSYCLLNQMLPNIAFFVAQQFQARGLLELPILFAKSLQGVTLQRHGCNGAPPPLLTPDDSSPMNL